MVNNVGYAVAKSVFETSSEEWDRVIDINPKSGFLCTKHLGHLMADTGGALSSTSALVSNRSARPRRWPTVRPGAG